MNFFKGLYERISTFGISPDTPHLTKLAVNAVNWLVAITLPITIFLSVFFLDELTIYDTINVLLLISIFGTYLLLMGLGKVRAAILVVFIFLPLAGMVSIIFFGQELSDAIWFTFCIMLGFVAYESRIAQFLIVLWNFCCYMGGALSNAVWGKFNPAEMPILQQHIIAMISVAVLCYLGWIIVRENRLVRKKIVSQNEELKEVNQELYEINTDLKNFTYITSHDLKTPLNSILSFQRLIERKLQNIDDPSLKKYLYFANSSAENMMTILNDLRQFSELAKKLNKQQFKYVNVHPIIEQITTEYENAQDKRGEIVIKGELPPIRAVESHARLIFQNLIGNGLKYNESDEPTITISGSHMPQGAYIHVRDNGIGMDPKYLEQIFEPFKRLHTKRDYEGTGFGLAICKRIVEKMDGNIKVQSEIGKGSTFSIHFPNETDTLVEVIEEDLR